MKKLILLLTVTALAGCVSVKAAQKGVSQKSYVGMDRAAIQQELGLPHQISYQNGNEVLTYWRDEGGIAGHTKYTIVLKDGRVARFMKRPTSSKLNANLSEQDLRNLEKQIKAAHTE